MSIPDLLNTIGSNARIFVPGSSGEPTAFFDALLANQEYGEGLDITSTLVPGINRFDIGRLRPDARMTGLFMQPAFATAQREGKYRHLPLSYGAFASLIRDQLRFDVVVMQVSPPDNDGNCSLGPAAEFLPLAIPRATKLVGLINRNTPRVPNAPTVPFAAFSSVAEVDTPLVTYDPGKIDATSRTIATNIAQFIEDGTALQVGLGKVPAAVMDALHDRRNLRLYSGMLSDGVMALSEAGALDQNWRHTTCVVVGSELLYNWLHRRNDINVCGCELTHNASKLAQLDRFVAVQSALEIDLFGQCNLETLEGAAVSGPGGAPDFARAAKHSVRGRSIVALPATHSGGKASRIVPRLGSDGIATLNRTDVDLVVTEVGVADLRNKSVHERAAAIIGVAADAFREDLSARWHAIAANL